MNLLVDQYLLNFHFNLFKDFIESKSGMAFVSFNSNPYTEQQEGYKFDIHKQARQHLNFGKWKAKNVGTGIILKAVIKSIEMNINNLVQWQARYGDDKRPHHKLYIALNNLKERRGIEKLFYDFYIQKIADDKAFELFVEWVGKKYSLIAYFYFLKDKSRFMPIAPKRFDSSFEKLSIDFKTSHKCSWDNYYQYNNIIGQVRDYISLELSSEVTLLDAHSFLWMLSSQMEYDESIPTKARNNLNKYHLLSSKGKEAVINARIGQGIFRKHVIDYWSSCAVTGCNLKDVLIASHIKPWKACDLKEAIDPINGLLLLPNLDKAFDMGYISFDKKGNILISQALSKSACTALGIDKNMKLLSDSKKHDKYLKYHRENILKKANKSLE